MEKIARLQNKRPWLYSKALHHIDRYIKTAVIKASVSVLYQYCISTEAVTV